LDEAIEKYQKVTELAPKFYLAYKFWADTLKQQGKSNEAENVLRNASEVDPQEMTERSPPLMLHFL